MRSSMLVFLALCIIPSLVTIISFYTKTIDYVFLTVLWSVPTIMAILTELVIEKPEEKSV